MKKVCLFLLTVLVANTAFAEEFSPEKREQYYRSMLSASGIIVPADSKTESLIGQKACFETQFQTSRSVDCLKIVRIVFLDPELFLDSAGKEFAHYKGKKWYFKTPDGSSVAAHFLSIQK